MKRLLIASTAALALPSAALAAKAPEPRHEPAPLPAASEKPFAAGEMTGAPEVVFLNIDPAITSMVGAPVEGPNGEMIGIVQSVSATEAGPDLIVATRAGRDEAAEAVTLPADSFMFDSTTQTVSTTLTLRELGMS